jgi:hypothetical protein
MVVIVFKIFFTWKYIKIIFYFIFKILFLTSIHQNDKKKYTKIIFKKSSSSSPQLLISSQLLLLLLLYCL